MTHLLEFTITVTNFSSPLLVDGKLLPKLGLRPLTVM
jgi:hypothetical protein